MNLRERLLKVFTKEKPDIIPWYADLSWWYNSQVSKGLLPEKYQGDKGYLKLHQDVGAGIYLYPPILWEEKESGDIKIFNINKAELTITEIHTPCGIIKSILSYSKESFTNAYIEKKKKNVQDLKTMKFVFENKTYRPSYDKFLEIDNLWNGYGIPAALAPIPVSPIQKLLTRWAGVETTINLMCDYPDDFDNCLTSIAQSEDPVFEILCNSPAKIIVFPENLSSAITGVNLFKKYSFSIYKNRIDKLHMAGKYVILHIDGTLKGLLPLLSEIGVDAAEAVTPEPVGDIPVSKLRESTGDKIIIWGGLPGVLFSPIYSQKMFIEHIKHLLETFSSDNSFVLGVADQVPPDAEFNRICLVTELVNTYGKRK